MLGTLENFKTKRISECEIPVLWSQLDSNGHVNNGVYQFYFDEARMRALEDKGFSLNEMRKDKIGPVMFRSELDYKKQLHHPDTVIIKTWMKEMEKARGILIQDLYRKSDGELVCHAEFHCIFMDFNKNRPWKIPEEKLKNLME